MSRKEQPFSFLKEGNDKEFDNAMNSIGMMYDDMFSDQVDQHPLFKGLQLDNNPPIQSIGNMMKQVFKPTEVDPRDHYELEQAHRLPRNHIEVDNSQELISEQQIVIGEPFYPTRPLRK